MPLFLGRLRALKRARRRARVRAIKAAGGHGDRLTLRRSGKKSNYVPENLPELDTRTCSHIVRISWNPIKENARRYNNGYKVCSIDHNTISFLKITGVVEPGAMMKVMTSRMATPTVGVMLDNIMKYDRPEVVMDSLTINYVAHAFAFAKINDMRCGSVMYSRHTYPIFLSSVLDAFPGLTYRQIGRAKKRDADELASIEAYAARQLIQLGSEVRDRPCALFGRGKIVEGIESGQLAGGAGRLVMAPDGRDHLIMQPEAKTMYKAITDACETSHIMLGVSYPNYGAAAFTANIICDIMGMPRVCPDHKPMFKHKHLINDINSTFAEKYEKLFAYFVLDVSKQDTTISRTLLDYYFDAVFYAHKAYGKSQHRLGRLLEWQKRFHTNTLFCLPDGSLWRKHRGNVSGSPHTTTINSWSQNLCVTATLLFIFNGSIPPGVTWRIYGDNTLIVVPRVYTDRCNLETLSDVLVEMFEQRINVEESYEGVNLFVDNAEDPIKAASFLGKRFMVDGRVWRPTYETLVSLCHPESSDVSQDTVLSRANGLAMDNPGNMEVQHILNELMDRLQEKGAVMKDLNRFEIAKMIHGRGFSEEEASINFRMAPISVRQLYMTTPDDPTRDPFRHYDSTNPYERSRYSIVHTDLWCVDDMLDFSIAEHTLVASQSDEIMHGGDKVEDRFGDGSILVAECGNSVMLGTGGG